MSEHDEDDVIEKAKTPRGGWTRKQLAEWGVPWPPPKGWRKELSRQLREVDASAASTD